VSFHSPSADAQAFIEAAAALDYNSPAQRAEAALKVSELWYRNGVSLEDIAELIRNRSRSEWHESWRADRLIAAACAACM
jgi:hypothetical protein